VTNSTRFRIKLFLLIKSQLQSIISGADARAEFSIINLEDMLAYEFILNRDLLAQLYPSCVDSIIHIFLLM
jgi:hypothetical protein